MALRRRPERPQSPWVRRLKIFLVVFVPLFFVFAVVHVTRSTHDICAVCYSSRRTNVSGLGTDPFAPWKETDRREDVDASEACRDFFGGACPHRWERYSTRASFFVFMTMTGGTLSPQPLARQYQEQPRFRGLVQRKVAAGDWTADDFRAALGIPAEPSAADLADPARRRLVVRGVQLLEDGGERGSWREWERALSRTEPGAAPPGSAKPR